jgi:hypothetical protein
MLPHKKLLFTLFLFSAFLAFAAASSTYAETFRNPRRIPLAVDPYGVATGDLNGDGRNDIVWTEHPAYPGTTVLHVLLAGANGQYTSAPDLTLPFYPTFIDCIIEDVTGDKHNDLICVGADINYTDVFLLTYPGKGDGTFGPPVQTKMTAQPTFSNPIIARAGDLNGDGFPDVLVMNAYYSGILPYLSDGQGGFKAGASFQGSFNYSVPTVTDLNGDGKLDVLWPTGPRVDLGNGDGTFAPIAQYDPGFLSICAFGDVDGDGHLDAACTWYDNGDINGHVHLTVLHGNSDGSFDTTPLFTRTFGSGANEYDGIATILSPVLVADLNGDGYADIVSHSGDGYSVLLGGPNLTWNGEPQQFVSASFQSEGGILGIYGVSIADMNGDGLPDIVAIGPHGLYITYAQHDGTLSSAPAPEVGEVSTSVTLVDVDGDGNLDAVSAGDTALKLSLGHGDGTFGPPQAITTSGNFGDTNYIGPMVISGDFNGDGKQDLLATGSTGAYTTQNYILFGHGDGTFDAPLPIANSILLGKVADLNNDGRSDVISIQNNALATNVLAVNLSRGDGTFTTVSTNLPVEMVINTFTTPSAGPALADFRHSGRLDAAVASVNHVYLLRSHGDGSFDTNGTVLAIPDLPNLSKVAVGDITAGDFDGDGNQDIAVLEQYGSGIYNLSAPTSAAWVFYGKGDGTFSGATLAGTFDRHAQTVSAGDLNGDGLADLVLTSYDVYEYNGVLIVHALPNRAWGPEVDYTGGDGLSPLWITDINHDGRNDLIFSNALRGNYASNSISVLLNEAAVSVSGTVTASPEPSNVTYPFTLQASLIPSNAGDVLSGNVTFSLDGVVVGSGPLSGNTASLSLSGLNVAAGSHSLSASWAGDATYPPLTLNGSHTVSLLPLTVSLAASPTSLSVGGTVTATATFTPGIVPNLPGYQFTGSMTLYDNGVAIAQQPVSTSGFSFTLSSLAVGVHTLSVSYAGDAFFLAAQSNSVAVTVTGAATVATLTALPANSTYGTPVTLAANIAAAGSAGSSLPTGSVVFTIDGKPLAPVTLANAAAGAVVSNLGVGAHSVSCTYSGDSTFAASVCNIVPITVNAAATVITVSSSQNPSLAYTPVTFSVHLMLGGQPAPAGTQFTFSLQNNSGNVLLTTDASGNATYTTSQLFARTWDITVIFSGAVNYLNSVVHYAQIVTAAPTVLSLTASPNPAYIGQSVRLNAGATPSGTTFPTGTVTFLEGPAVLGTGTLNSAGQASFSTSTLTVGTHIIFATYPGDSGFLAGTSQAISVVILPQAFTLTISAPTLSIPTEHYKSFSASVQSLGFQGPVQLTCSVPQNVYLTCDIANSSLQLAVGGSATSTLILDTDVLLRFKASLESGPRHTAFSSEAIAFALLLPLPLGFLVRRRRLRTLPLMLILFALGATLSLTGCGDKYPAHTPPGAYDVVITAAGTPAGSTATITQTVHMQLAVTPE